MHVTGEGPPFMKVGSGKRSRVLYKQSDVCLWLENKILITQHGIRSVKGDLGSSTITRRMQKFGADNVSYSKLRCAL